MLEIVINNPKGGLLCAYSKRNSENVAAALHDTKPKISNQLAHEILGHMDKERTSLVAKGPGYELALRALIPCEVCASVK